MRRFMLSLTALFTPISTAQMIWVGRWSGEGEQFGDAVVLGAPAILVAK